LVVLRASEAHCRANYPDHDRAVKTIPKVARPRKDPVYGSHGPLLRLWR
jgi:uncharacterized protein YjlB